MCFTFGSVVAMLGHWDFSITRPILAGPASSGWPVGLGARAW